MRPWLAALLALAVIEAFVFSRVELTFDEAYYALWARWPQAGYFDHPPMVAWWIAGAEAALGRSEAAVRAPFWLAGLALPALVWLIGLRLYGEARVAGAAALLLTGAPLLAGAPLATPDTPLALFWTLALLGLVEVWRGTRGAWALTGVAAGLAGLSKMTAGFLGLGIVLALVVTPSLRAQFRRPGPYGAAALALGVLSPFLAWNAAHGFATFAKQGGRLAARAFAPRYLGEFFGAQLLLANPATVAGVAFAGARPKGEPARLLAASLAPALAYFLLHALHDRVQGNWPAPLYPALALLAAEALGARAGRVAAVSATLGLAAAAAVGWHLVTGWPALGPGDPALRIGGWREIAAQVSAEARAQGAGFVVAKGYAATALLAYYGDGLPVVEDGEPERWGFRPALDTTGRGLGFGPPDFEADLARRFAQVTPLRGVVRAGGERFEIFTLEGAR